LDLDVAGELSYYLTFYGGRMNSIPTPFATSEVYAGHRILEAMRSASAYVNEIYSMAQAAAGRGSGVILEFGAGDGVFVERFLKDGRAVACVEPDAKSQAALRVLGVPVVADIRELPNEAYDCVYTINVLEHLARLDQELAEICRVLRPGGTLFAFVPAFQTLWTSLDDEVRHVRRFTRRTLTDTLRRSGLEIEASRYFDSLGFVAALGVRVLERFGLFRYSPRSVGFYDKMLFPVSKVADRACFPLFGKNVVALARKPAILR
jgi:SAM-dependent methyltransferase